MSQLHLISFLHQDYVYIGEGNSNIVLSISDSGLMLRMRKSEIKNPNESYFFNADELQTLKLEYLFYCELLQPIFGNRLIHTPKIVELDKEEVVLLNHQIKSLRPLSRQHKQLRCNFGMLTIDYTSNRLFPQLEYDTLCVEIKCKRGWMPECSMKYGKCTFCMNQYLKLKKQMITSVSGYCPLDLFSGNRARMKKSIMELILTPQNNFRMFIGGKLVFSETNQTITFNKILSDYFKCCNINIDNTLEKFTNMLIELLLWSEYPRKKSLNSMCNCIHLSDTFNVPNNYSESLLKGNCNNSSDGLPIGSVLERILQIQMLEQPNIHNLNVTSDYDYLQDLLYMKNIIKTSSPTKTNNFLSQKLEPLQKYMLACSAKDCSIMMSFKPLKGVPRDIANDFITVEYNNNYFLAKVGIIDFDPKPASKLESHISRDKNAVESFLSFNVN